MTWQTVMCFALAALCVVSAIAKDDKRPWHRGLHMLGAVCWLGIAFGGNGWLAHLLGW